MKSWSFLLILFILTFPLRSEIIVSKDENGNIIIMNKPAKESAKKSRISKPLPQKKNDFDPIIDVYANKYGIDKDLVHAVIQVESDYNHLAVSKKGAMGLMQLHPATANDLGVQNPFDVESNIEGGIRYLREMLDRYGDLRKALAAYNAGPEAVDKYNGIPPYKETQNYVKKVLSIYKKEPVRNKIIYKYESVNGEVVISDVLPQPGTYKGKVHVIRSK